MKKVLQHLGVIIMPNCRFCNKSLANKGFLAIHERSCKANPNRIPKVGPTKGRQLDAWKTKPTIVCPECGANICESRFASHLKSKACARNSSAKLDNLQLIESNKYKCKFCDHLSNTRAGLHQHQNKCLYNPDNIDKLAAWEAKLATSNTVKRHGGILLDAEAEQRRREHISQTMKQNPKAGGRRQGSGRGKKGWYKGFFCDSTYELVYVIYNLDHNIEFKRCNRVYTYEYQGETHKYYPDFELPDGSIVETKGYHSEIVDVKTASVTDRPIKVLFEKDLQYAFDWVKQNYTYSQLSDLYN